MWPGDGQGYRDPVSGGRAFTVYNAGQGYYDDGGSVRTAGHGIGLGGGPDGQQADQKAACDGEWKAVWDAEPWGSGTEGGKLY